MMALSKFFSSCSFKNIFISKNGWGGRNRTL